MAIKKMSRALSRRTVRRAVATLGDPHGRGELKEERHWRGESWD